VTNVMEDVINRGTAYPVRARGFDAPAAGKTGTSRDGWFAGFTSNLLCVVWVGFDDNRTLTLTGGAAAAPIWAEFMKRAVSLPAYKDTKDFPAPPGIVSVTIDPETLQLATPKCPTTRQEVFIDGTQPTVYCQKHGGSSAGAGLFPWLSRIFGSKSPPPPEQSVRAPTTPAPATAAPGWHRFNSPQRISPGQSAPTKKDGFWHRFKSFFGGKDDPTSPKTHRASSNAPGGL
jgi:penicillin-binding protein 1B